MSALDAIAALLEADVPCLIWGAPGTGKTAALLALARDRGAHAEVLIGSSVDPIDVGGYLLPRHDGAGVEQHPPPWARRIADALAAGREAWLVLDELSCAPPSVQAALLRVVHERAVGALSIAGCRVVAASNPPASAADGGELPAAAANRWAHVEWAVDVAAWCDGTMRGWGAPARGAHAAAARASIAAYVARHPSALAPPVPEGADAGRAWPSPRAWTAAIAALAVAGVDSPQALALVAACVGRSAASEWATWRAEQDLPDPEDVLAGRACVPERGDRAAATLLAVVAAALAEHPERQARDARAWEILAEQRPDVALAAARALLGDRADVPDAAVDLGRRLRRVGA